MINDLAPFEIFVVEMNNAIFRFGHSRQELLLYDFGICSMPLKLILHFLLLFGFHCNHSLFAQIHHYLVIAIIVEIGVAVFIFFELVLYLIIILILHLLLHFSLHLLSLVLYSFLHYHFVENVTSNLHSSARHTSSSVFLCHFEFCLI